MRFRSHLARLAAAVFIFALIPANADEPRYFGIRVVDAQTGRGVPLVELRTVSHIGCVTDSQGLAAFFEPGLMNQKVFFHVRSHGYETPRDGFGQDGVQLQIEPGKIAEIKLKRVNIAERLYRLTGEGIYRDSVLLGQPVPIKEPLLNAQVSGQDSAQVAIYRGKIHWLWGDTLRPKYPLGHFWMAGATADLPGQGGLAPSVGVDLSYFTDAEGFSRPMWPHTDPGPIWADGLVSVKDATGRERLVAHYSHMKDLATVLDHGLSVFNDDKQQFENVRVLPLAEKWRCLSGHPLRIATDGGDWFYFPAAYDSMPPFPAVRVRADYDAILDPAKYEAFTPLPAGGTFAGAATTLDRTPDGQLIESWKRDAPPLTPAHERELIKAGVLRADEGRYQPRDVETGQPIEIHNGSVQWNAHLRQYVFIATESGGKSSYLGEVWFGAAASPLGPWRWCRRILTHDHYTFYNPLHHPFLDEEGGRYIYFEGTYTATFSGNNHPTPRYEYNQIMYRLDLADPRLTPPPDAKLPKQAAPAGKQ